MHLAHMIQVIGCKMVHAFDALNAWYDTPFIEGREVGRMLDRQSETWNCDKMWDFKGVSHTNQPTFNANQTLKMTLFWI